MRIIKSILSVTLLLIILEAYVVSGNINLDYAYLNNNVVKIVLIVDDQILEFINGLYITINGSKTLYYNLTNTSIEIIRLPLGRHNISLTPVKDNVTGLPYNMVVEFHEPTIMYLRLNEIFKIVKINYTSRYSIEKLDVKTLNGHTILHKIVVLNESAGIYVLIPVNKTVDLELNVMHPYINSPTIKICLFERQLIKIDLVNNSIDVTSRKEILLLEGPVFYHIVLSVVLFTLVILIIYASLGKDLDRKISTVYVILWVILLGDTILCIIYNAFIEYLIPVLLIFYVFSTIYMIVKYYRKIQLIYLLILLPYFASYLYGIYLLTTGSFMEIYVEPIIAYTFYIVIAYLLLLIAISIITISPISVFKSILDFLAPITFITTLTNYVGNWYISYMIIGYTMDYPAIIVYPIIIAITLYLINKIQYIEYITISSKTSLIKTFNLSILLTLILLFYLLIPALSINTLLGELVFEEFLLLLILLLLAIIGYRLIGIKSSAKTKVSAIDIALSYCIGLKLLWMITTLLSMTTPHIQYLYQTVIILVFIGYIIYKRISALQDTIFYKELIKKISEKALVPQTLKDYVINRIREYVAEYGLRRTLNVLKKLEPYVEDPDKFKNMIYEIFCKKVIREFKKRKYKANVRLSDYLAFKELRIDLRKEGIEDEKELQFTCYINELTNLINTLKSSIRGRDCSKAKSLLDSIDNYLVVLNDLVKKLGSDEPLNLLNEIRYKLTLTKLEFYKVCGERP